MARDTFGGPFACHITHQSVGSGYLGPVTATVAECAVWLIKLFLQIADQCLWVGRWIFPFPFSLLLFFFSPLLDCSAGAWCIGCFQEVYWMTDTSRRGGRLAGRAIVNCTGIWHGQYTKKYQLAAYNRVITIDFVLWEMCMKNQSILLENHQHRSLLGDLFHHWHM